MPAAAWFAYGGLAGILALQACADTGVLHRLLADTWPGGQGGRIGRRAVQLRAPDHAAMRPSRPAEGIVMHLRDREPLGDIACTASITGLREQHLAWCRCRHGVAGCSAERAPRSGRTGTRLAAGMTDGLGGQRASTASRTGDPRFWALVMMLARPSKVNFMASDLRLSKNLNWRSRWRGASLWAGIGEHRTQPIAV